MIESRTENVAVFFTDVEGSTTYFKVHGDSAGRELLLEHHSLVGKAVENHGGVSVKTIGDSVLAYFNKPASAVEAAVSILDSMEEHLNDRPPEEQIRIRIAIHYGPVIIEQNDIFGDVVNWASKLTHLTMGGDICVSRQMLDQLKDNDRWSFEPMTVKDADVEAERGAFRILRNGQLPSRKLWPDLADFTVPGEFRYRGQLIEGPFRPCFYCGSGKHRISECPSKEIPEVTGAFEKLGYMSVEDINILFSEYLREDRPNHDSPALVAHHAFYDLKRVFQIRFFRSVWDAENKTWDEVSRNMPSGSRWGAAWLAQDCIRVSNYDTAESLLAEPVQKNQPDYKIHCAAGFLNLERGYSLQALTAFSTALRYTRSTVERVFVLLLLDRMAAVITDVGVDAKDRLNEILITDRWCSEAVYLDIVRAFQNGHTASALKRLEKLIQDERNYFVAALIDPELKNDRAEVTFLLNNLINKARDAAGALVPSAKQALAWLEKSFGETNDSVKAARKSWSRMQDLMNKNCYFSFLDAVLCGEEINSSYERELKSQKRLVYAGAESLERRLDACFVYARKNKAAMKNTSFYGELEEMEKKMKHLIGRLASSDPAMIRETLVMIGALKAQVEEMEHRIKAFEKQRRLKNSTFRFLESFGVVVFGSILAAFVLTPVAWTVFHGMESIIQTDMKSFQKGLLIVSLIGGFCFSFLSAFKTLYDE